MTTDQLLVEMLETMVDSHVSAFGDTCFISEYFYKTFNRTWNAGLQKDVEKMSKKYSDYDIWVSGHSLGAAICSVAATAISYYYPELEERIKVVSGF
jgi:putative lipase involved disintegration of autophagic bodies